MLWTWRVPIFDRIGGDAGASSWRWGLYPSPSFFWPQTIDRGYRRAWSWRGLSILGSLSRSRLTFSFLALFAKQE